MTGIGYKDKRIPFEDGLTPDEFNIYTALVAMAIEFSKATGGIVDFVVKRLAAKCG